MSGDTQNSKRKKRKKKTEERNRREGQQKTPETTQKTQKHAGTSPDSKRVRRGSEAEMVPFVRNNIQFGPITVSEKA